MEIPNITEHTKIVNYFKNNNGIKLQELEDGLILAEPCAGKKTGHGRLQQIFSNVHNDILCFNKDNNDIVIVEVKSESEMADYNTFGQILYYHTEMEYIKCANTELGKSNVNTVRCIILAKKIHKSLKKLVNKYNNVTPKIDLKEYYWGAEENIIIKEG